MNVRSSPQTILDYCTAWRQKQIQVNRSYQRSDRVWPEAARSYLIESIILQFPIPKLSLHQNVDPKTGAPFKEIVDGQQRTMAIVGFYEGKYELAGTLETEALRGRKYSSLGEDEQQAFLNYSLDIDLFVATPAAEVREAFRRMNSYTIPLNPEEERHAQWQGAFKWFINRLGHTFSETLLKTGTFSEKQIIRMQDTKLLTEVVHASLNGIQTTNSAQLTALYRRYDSSFPANQSFSASIGRAVDEIGSWNDLHATALMKPYNMYALILALMHIRKPIPKLTRVFRVGAKKRLADQYVLPNLSALSEALEEPDENAQYAEFITAAKTRTNVKDQREKRFVWMCKALTQKAI